jgi:hypothetical protein
MEEKLSAVRNLIAQRDEMVLNSLSKSTKRSRQQKSQSDSDPVPARRGLA